MLSLSIEFSHSLCARTFSFFVLALISRLLLCCAQVQMIRISSWLVFLSIVQIQKLPLLVTHVQMVRIDLCSFELFLTCVLFNCVGEGGHCFVACMPCTLFAHFMLFYRCFALHECPHIFWCAARVNTCLSCVSLNVILISIEFSHSSCACTFSFFELALIPRLFLRCAQVQIIRISLFYCADLQKRTSSGWWALFCCMHALSRELDSPRISLCLLSFCLKYLMFSRSPAFASFLMHFFCFVRILIGRNRCSSGRYVIDDLMSGCSLCCIFEHTGAHILPLLHSFSISSCLCTFFSIISCLCTRNDLYKTEHLLPFFAFSVRTFFIFLHATLLTCTNAWREYPDTFWSCGGCCNCLVCVLLYPYMSRLARLCIVFGTHFLPWNFLLSTLLTLVCWVHTLIG